MKIRYFSSQPKELEPYYLAYTLTTVHTSVRLSVCMIFRHIIHLGPKTITELKLISKSHIKRYHSYTERHLHSCHRLLDLLSQILGCYLLIKLMFMQNKLFRFATQLKRFATQMGNGSQYVYI